MDINDTIKRLRNHDISRRELGRAMASAGLATVVVPVVAGKAKADDEAIYFTWAGYDIPEIWPGYVEKHGVPPETPIFGDAEESFTKVRSGFVVDVMHPCSNNVPR